MMDRLGAMFMAELQAAKRFLSFGVGRNHGKSKLAEDIAAARCTHYAEAKPAPKVDVAAVHEEPGRFTLSFTPYRDPHHSRVLRRTRRMKSIRMYRRDEHPRASASVVASALSSHATRRIAMRRAEVKEARRLRKIAASN